MEDHAVDDLGRAYLRGVIREFEKQRALAEGAFTQVRDPRALFTAPAGSANSIAVVVKHLGGNLRSRWTDFLDSDGEKPWRNRDGEFTLTAADTWESLRAGWDAGWQTLLASLASLEPADLQRTVRIRGEEHRVLEAIQRALTHAGYHTGQIVLLARLAAGEAWTWLSVPREDRRNSTGTCSENTAPDEEAQPRDPAIRPPTVLRFPKRNSPKIPRAPGVMPSAAEETTLPRTWT